MTDVLANARLVLADRVIERGWLAVADGAIAEFGEGAAPEKGLDLAGDLLIPGLVELHTDHLEMHFVPRPKVRWDPVAAVVAYDAQIAASGIATVLDSLRVWREGRNVEEMDGDALTLGTAIAQAREAGILRADHYLHLRCEVPTESVVEDAAAMIARPDVRLLSLMDHTPGQRQFRDEEKLRDYYRGKKGGLTDAELDDLFRVRLELHRRHAASNNAALVELAHRHDVPLASHDDTTTEHVDDAVRDKVAIAEFPTTLEAANGLHAAGIKVLMGAPNLVRGGSHSGNIATATLARTGTLDILSSDYVPSSLLTAALQLPAVAPGIDLPAAIRTVTKTPAEAVGFADRGEIAVGKRADLARVHRSPHGPVVRALWRQGERVT